VDWFTNKLGTRMPTSRGIVTIIFFLVGTDIMGIIFIQPGSWCDKKYEKHAFIVFLVVYELE
jgi:hypothetical protein